MRPGKVTEPGSRSGGTETTKRAKLSGARQDRRPPGPRPGRARWQPVPAPPRRSRPRRGRSTPRRAGRRNRRRARAPREGQGGSACASRDRCARRSLADQGSPAWPGTRAPGYRRRCRWSGLFGAFDLTEHRVCPGSSRFGCAARPGDRAGGSDGRSLRGSARMAWRALGCHRRSATCPGRQVSGLTSAWAAPRARSIASRASRVRSGVGPALACCA